MTDQNPPAVAGNIIQILANLPDFLRKPVLQNRLKEFYSMSEHDRREAISMALAAAPTIEPAKLSILVKTWLEVLAEFDTGKRMTMFHAYCNQLLANPSSLEKLDFKSLTDTFLSLDDKQREKLIDSLHEVLFAFPRASQQQILQAVPEYALRALKMK